MRWHRRWLFLGGCALAAVLSVCAARSEASQYFDNQRGEISARMSTQNTFQHNGADSINWVQWRNELGFDLKYDLIREGVGQSWGPITGLKFNILYRARMDPVYLLRESYRDRNYNRGDFEFPEGRTPRELFFDIAFGGILGDLSLRIGKQQVVWGDADLFRSLDIVNPLDIRQNGFLGEDLADFRQPLWIAKALYNFGNISSFWNEAGMEVFFSPNSRPQGNQSNLLYGETYKIHTPQSTVDGDGFTRTMSLPFRQVRAPWEFGRVGARFGDAPAVLQVGGLEATGGGGLADFMYRIKNDVSPSELDTSALMAGVRLLGTTIGNANFTLNYLFKRTDASSWAAPLDQLLDPSRAGTGALQGDTATRAVVQALTPDLNGNGIPDGQDEQIANCLRSRQPTGVAPGRGEVILDPRTAQALTGQPITFSGPWHGSVYSDPQHPELDTGIKGGTFGVAAGANQLKARHMSFDPVLPLKGFSAVDGLSHASFCEDVAVFHPWTHIVGMTLTYSDNDYTGLVFSLEQSFSTKEPRDFSASSPERLSMQRDHCPPNADGFPECTGADGKVFNAAANEKDFRTRLKRYTQVSRSLVGVDYLRSIAPQLGRQVSNPLLHSLLSDQWFFTFRFLDEYDTKYNLINHPSSFTQRYHQFNPFFTFAARGFFLHQTLHPTLAVALDAADKMSPLFFAKVGYFLTPRLEMRLGEVLYAGSSRNEDPGNLHYYADRDTFYIRLTYFLA